MQLHPRPAALLPVVILTAVTLGLRLFLPSRVIEAYYSRGLFVGLRVVLDHTVALIPLPLFYVFWLAVGWSVFRFIGRCRRKFRSGLRAGLWCGLRGAIHGVCVLTVVFMWLWGFNYGRVPVEDNLGFAVRSPNLDDLRQRVYTEAADLATLRRSIRTDSLPLTEQDLPADLLKAVRSDLTAALSRSGYPTAGHPRGWQLYPRGILLRWGTAGVYWPWVAQGHIDAGLHPLQKPAVLAHELAHAYGFGDEGSCSFWAHMAGLASESPALQYAIRLSYWRRLAGRLRYADPEGYLAWRHSDLDAGIRNDLTAIYANGELYRDIAPVLRDATYSAYLKAQGIHEGLLNYGRVVQLVEGYRYARINSGK